MTSFLLQFQEEVSATHRAEAKTSTATRTTRETADQDYANIALATKTKTITEVQREQPDLDPKYSHHLVFPKPKAITTQGRHAGNSAKTEIAATESNKQKWQSCESPGIIA